VGWVYLHKLSIASALINPLLIEMNKCSHLSESETERQRERERESGGRRKDLLAPVSLTINLWEDLRQDREREVEEAAVRRQRRKVSEVIAKAIKDNDNPTQLEVVPREEMERRTRELILESLNSADSVRGWRPREGVQLTEERRGERVSHQIFVWGD
jgi:hypothetical protein